MGYICKEGSYAKQDPGDGEWYCYINSGGKDKRVPGPGPNGQALFDPNADEKQGSSVTGKTDATQQGVQLGNGGFLRVDFPDSGNKKVTKSEEQTPDGRVTTTVTEDLDGGGTSTKTELTESPTVKKNEGGYYDRLDYLGGGRGPAREVTEYEAQMYPAELMAGGSSTGARGNPQYDDFQKGLQGFFGQKFMSYTTDQSAWNQLIEIARYNDKSPWDLLKQGQTNYQENGNGSGSGGGGGSGSGGTRYSYQELNEADVRALANSMSEEFIGRRITDKEFNKLLKRVRKEEGKSPTITSSSGSTSRTKQGITNEERKEVIAEILNEHPEYREFQMGEGALEYTREYLAEQKAKAAL